MQADSLLQKPRQFAARCGRPTEATQRIDANCAGLKKREAAAGTAS